MKRTGFIDGRRIKFLDDYILYFGTGNDISMKWDGDKLVMLPALSAQQVDFGDASHVVYLKLKGSLAITEKEFSVTMGSAGDPAGLFTQQEAGPGLRVNRQTTQAGYLVDFQIDGSSAFYVEGATGIAYSLHGVNITGDLTVDATKASAAATITQNATGEALVVNRVATSAGYIIDFQRGGTSVFYIEGDTQIAHFANRLKAQSYSIEGGADGADFSGTINTLTVVKGLVTAAAA